MAHPRNPARRAPIQPEQFEATLRRRERDGVVRPVHETNLSFAARLAEESAKKPRQGVFRPRQG